MKLSIKGKDIELKYTFNSFNYMEEFNVKNLEQIESKPFKMIPVIKMLLIGGLNHNPKEVYETEMVDAFLEEYVETNSIGELMADLMDELGKSSFFKSLQMETKKKK